MSVLVGAFGSSGRTTWVSWAASAALAWAGSPSSGESEAELMSEGRDAVTSVHCVVTPRVGAGCCKSGALVTRGLDLSGVGSGARSGEAVSRRELLAELLGVGS